MHRFLGIRVGVLTWAFLLFAPLQQCARAQDEAKPTGVDQYKPHGYVNDFAGILDKRTESRLNLICKDLDQKKRTQMAIVTIESLDGRPIKEFATELANLWGVGHKDNNRGILVLLSLNDSQYRIAVGYGLESVITDDEADRLGREMIPMLQAKRYGDALLHLANRLHDEILRWTK